MMIALEILKISFKLITSVAVLIREHMTAIKVAN